MAWIFKRRGGAAARALAEYYCADHGRFEQLTDRDADGDPPAEVACPDCGAAAPHVISAPGTVRARLFEFIRGKSNVHEEHRGKPSKGNLGVLDTRGLADGDTSWRAKRAQEGRDFELARVRRNMGRS